MTMIHHWPAAWWRAASPQFYLRPFSLSAASPFTGLRRISGPIVQLWVIEFPSVPVEQRTWRAMSAFLSRVGGVSGLIRIGDPTRRRPYYNALAAPAEEAFSDATEFSDGTGFVSGLVPPTATVGEASAADSETLLIHGLPASLAPALHAGDLLEIRPNGAASETGNLYEVAYDAPTNASGQTRVTISPPLRSAFAAGDQIVLNDPTSVFRMIDDGQGIVQHRPPSIGQVGFTLVEAI